MSKKISVNEPILDDSEIKAAQTILDSGLLSSSNINGGKYVKDFEKNITQFLDVKYAVAINSGTSALYASLLSLNIKSGDEVIIPSFSFTATASAVVATGATPVFVDISSSNYNIDISLIKSNITKKTKAIMPVHLTGRISEMNEINRIAKKYNLRVIEDSADTIGYTYQNSNTGKYSDVVTNSFYASHIITGAGSGGMVCFNDRKLYDRAKLLRGWGRSSAIFNESEGIKIRFSKKVDGIPYDGKYIFSALGYNFLPSEISAAFAIEQLKKLKKNIKIRIKNFEFLKKFFSNYRSFFKLPIQNKNVVTGWLAFPLVIKKNSNFSRRDLQIYLEKKGIQTRAIFTGNILRQPIMKNKYYKKHRKSYIVSDDVMKNGILIGCHHGLKKKDLYRIINTFKKILS